jgi:hypothetical protein
MGTMTTDEMAEFIMANNTKEDIEDWLAEHSPEETGAVIANLAREVDLLRDVSNAARRHLTTNFSPDAPSFTPEQQQYSVDRLREVLGYWLILRESQEQDQRPSSDL